MSDSVRPHRHKPPRVPHPWDSPGKNTGVGCHFLLQCMQVKSETEVTQSCPTISNPMDHSLPVSSIHGTFQARILEWNVIAFTGIELGLVIYFAYGNIHVSLLFSQIILPSPSPTESKSLWLRLFDCRAGKGKESRRASECTAACTRSWGQGS